MTVGGTKASFEVDAPDGVGTVGVDAGLGITWRCARPSIATPDEPLALEDAPNGADSGELSVVDTLPHEPGAKRTRSPVRAQLTRLDQHTDDCF